MRRYRPYITSHRYAERVWACVQLVWNIGRIIIADVNTDDSTAKAVCPSAHPWKQVKELSRRTTSKIPIQTYARHDRKRTFSAGCHFRSFCFLFFFFGYSWHIKEPFYEDPCPRDHRRLIIRLATSVRIQARRRRRPDTLVVSIVAARIAHTNILERCFVH